MQHLFFFLLLLATCQSAPPPKGQAPFEAFRLNYKKCTYDIVRFKAGDADLRFFLANDQGQKYRSFQQLKSELESKGHSLLFAINGGMYLKDGSPQGLYIEAGKEIKTIDTIQKAYGNFYLQPNGVFYIRNGKGFVSSTKNFLLSRPDSITYATQSGPMLVIDNTIHPVFVNGSENLNIRNGIGIDHAGNMVFAISNQKINLYDFATLFKEKLNCKNALYLDGFVSKAYIPDLNRLELGGNFGVMIGIIGNK